MGIARDVRRRRFWSRLGTHTFAAIGALALVATIADLFFTDPLEGRRYWLWLGLAAALGYGLKRAWPRPVEVDIGSPNTKIKVERGDLFQQSANLVIGVCDTFDTASPQIAPTSVQAKFQTAIYGNDLARLDSELEQELAHLPSVSIQKRGKTRKYELGTVVTLAATPHHYFLVAYSTMDENNKAHATVDGLWTSLANLWATVRYTSNGDAVCIPVIGGGQSGLSPVLPAEDAIRLTVLSFILASRSQPVCRELRIVALPGLYDKLDHLEIQAFLSSLRRA